MEQAQEFAYQAYESATLEEAVARAEAALKLDPECVDALTVKAVLTSEEAGDLIGALEHAASCGERALGEDFFAENMGDFWPLVETRPYLRCLKQLAEVLWSVGRRFDTVETYENLLDLDQEDHRGNAALLLSCYLAMGEVQRSWDLLEDYDDGEGAVYLWSWVLLQVMAGDLESARTHLDIALEANPHVVDYLFHIDDDDPETAPYLAGGSEAEARVCVQILGDAWDHNPDALLWLQTTLMEMGLLEPLDDGPFYDEDDTYFDDDIEPETKH